MKIDKTETEKLIRSIVLFQKAHQLTAADMAVNAGLHFNTLRNIGTAKWNPTKNTLIKLEKYIRENV